MADIGIARCEEDKIKFYSDEKVVCEISANGIWIVDKNSAETVIPVPNSDYEITFQYRQRSLVSQFIIQAFLDFLFQGKGIPVSYWYRNIVHLRALRALNPQQTRNYKLPRLKKFTRKPNHIRFIVEWVNEAYSKDPITYSKTPIIEKAFNEFCRRQKRSVGISTWISGYIGTDPDAIGDQ